MTTLARTMLAPASAPIEGRAAVIDGDTVGIARQRIRFNEIDALEARQYCFDAKDFEYPCGGGQRKLWTASSRPHDRCAALQSPGTNGRFVGDCSRADGSSVQAWLVEPGLAVDWPRYSNSAFAAEQAKRGVWQGRFGLPQDWRATVADME